MPFDSPVVAMADDSVLRLRPDVDESDASNTKKSAAVGLAYLSQGSFPFGASRSTVGWH